MNKEKKMTLKELRNENGMTILQVSNITKVPVRTYMRYEKDEEYGNNLKRNAIYETLKKECEVTENKRILKKEMIINKCGEVFKDYGNEIDFCYLFGSYAKGYAVETSDVDLCVSTQITGFDFVELVDKLQTSLHKNIDLLRLTDISSNKNLLKEIMKDGIKIYG